MFRFSLLPLLLCGPAMADDIVADLPIVGALVGSVSPVPVTVLAEAGADPHGLSLRPSQARALAEARLIVHLGSGLSPALDRAIAEAGAPTLSLAEVLAAGTESVQGRENADGHHDEDHGEPEDHAHADETHHAEEDHHADEAEHADADGHSDEDGHAEEHADAHAHSEDVSQDDGHTDAHGHGHAHGGADPHIWLDYPKVNTWLAALSAALAEAGLDPRPVPDIDLAAEIDADLRAGLPQDMPTVLATHDNWSYLTAALGITPFAAIADSDAVAPGAKAVGALRARIEAGEIDCILGAPGDPMGQAEALSADYDLPIVHADPQGDASLAGLDRYRSVFTGFAEALTECSSARR